MSEVALRRTMTPESSAVLSVWYDRYERELEVQYRSNPSKIYVYLNVPMSAALDCLQAASVGRFLAEVMRPMYRYEVVECVQ